MTKDMPKLAKNDNQLTLIYSAQTRVGKHALAYLQGSRKKVEARNIDEAPLTGSQWAELADALDKQVGDLVNRKAVKGGNGFEEYNAEDWVKILKNQPQVLTQPIVINGNKMKQVSSPTEVLAFFNVDSAGIDKTPYTKDPTTPEDVEE